MESALGSSRRPRAYNRGPYYEAFLKGYIPIITESQMSFKGTPHRRHRAEANAALTVPPIFKCIEFGKHRLRGK
jgi:hypothetical protein